MSNIVLSASVRQNLLSLQSTADLLATTQNRLATGNKVNTALDNPTNYFTAQSLNNRASDISNLLDSIGNGVQVLQAANTGITSLQSLVDSAKSVANQALQAAVGYSSKSTLVTAANAGATADNILGGAATNASATATGAVTTINLSADGATNATDVGTSNLATLDLTGTAAGHATTTGTGPITPFSLAAATNGVATAGTTISASTTAATHAATSGSVDLSGGYDASSTSVTFSINSHSVTLDSSGGTAGVYTQAQIEDAINQTSGIGVVAGHDVNGNLTLTSTNTAGASDSITTSGLSSFAGIADGSHTTGAAAATGGIDATTASTGFSINGVAVALSPTGGTHNDGHYSLTDLETAINGTNGITVHASDDTNGHLILTSTGTKGASDTVAITGLTGGLTNVSQLGFTAGSSYTSAGGTAAETFSFDVNGTTVSLSGGQSGLSVTGASIATAITGATAADVTASYTNNALTLTSTNSAHTGSADTITVNNYTDSKTAATLGFSSAISATGASAAPLPAVSFDVNGHTVTLAGGASYTATDIATAINNDATGVHASIVNGKLSVASTSSTKGVADTVTIDNFSGSNDASLLGFAAGASSSTTGADATNFTFKVNGNTVSLAGGSSYDGTAVAAAINNQVTGVAANYTGGHLTVASTGTAGSSDAVTIDTFSSGDATTNFGFTNAAVSTTGSNNTGGLDGETLTIAATGGGTATSLTFGSAGGVTSLNDLNSKLADNNLLATIDSTGALTITTTNDAASATIGALSGTAVSTVGSSFHTLAKSATAPVQDAAAQLVRSNLVNQYNNILDQITTTAQDASYNGIDLLNGDQLKLTFNETGTSTLKIQGVSFNSTGLGLSKLSAGTGFLDNAGANAAISSLDTASSSLRTEASALGSNLSIVQIRQDFSKNLINVLQTGSSNLTLADTNEEAANSQALSTRQSIAVSALALANQSQQGVLQLLR